jgi:predicted Zn-dependent protease
MNPNRAFLPAICYLIAISCVSLWAQSPSSSPPAAQQSTTIQPAVTVEIAKNAAEPASPLNAATELYRSGKIGEAEAAYRAILQNDPKSAPAYVGLFRVLLRQKHLEDAASAMNKAVELAPNSDAVHTAQGELHFRQGKIGAAEADFVPLVKAGTNEARAYLGLAKLYWAAARDQHGKLR